jgi:hypothetical protein
VSVKITDSPVDLIGGLCRALVNIVNNRREKSSVISLSVGYAGASGFTRESALASVLGADLIDLVELIHGYGIPLLIAAGNDSTERNPNIDEIPQVLESPYIPIINVGGTGFDYSRHSASQYGPQLTIYAPFKAVALNKNGEEETHLGTSFGK